MSGIINKVKDAVTPGHHEPPNSSQAQGTSNLGPHKHDLTNKLDPRVDQHAAQQQTTSGYGGTAHSSTHGPQTTSSTSHGHNDHYSHNLASHGDTRGPGAYGMEHSTMTGARTSGAMPGQTATAGAGYGAESGTGPHKSSMMNRVDPTVDSDRDGKTMGSSGTYGGSHSHGTTGYGSSAGNYGSSTTSGNYGPHGSSTMNRVDPTVDSDRDGKTMGSSGAYGGSHGTTGYDTSSAGNYGSAGNPYGSTTSGGNYGSSTTGGYGSQSSGTAGPHSSSMMNKLDPRVDSDRDNRARHDALAGSSYTAHGSSTTAGPHGSNTMNKLDPRVDSDMDNRNAMGSQRGF